MTGYVGVGVHPTNSPEIWLRESLNTTSTWGCFTVSPWDDSVQLVFERFLRVHCWSVGNGVQNGSNTRWRLTLYLLQAPFTCYLLLLWNMASSSVRIASAKQSQTASEVPLYNCTAVKSLSFQPAQTAQATKTIRNTCVSNVSNVGSPSLEEVSDFVNRASKPTFSSSGSFLVEALQAGQSLRESQTLRETKQWGLTQRSLAFQISLLIGEHMWHHLRDPGAHGGFRVLQLPK